MKLQSFEAITRALEQANVRYLVAGGLAVNAHGYLRFTKDVDLVIELAPDNVLRAVEALEALGYRPTVPVDPRQLADPSHRQSWIEDKGMKVFQLWSESYSDSPIDIFVEIPFSFSEEYNAALRKPLYGSIDVRFVQLETLIRMKQAANREQDRIDVHHLRMRLDDNG